MDPSDAVRTTGPAHLPCRGAWATHHKRATCGPRRDTAATPPPPPPPPHQRGFSHRAETPVSKGERDPPIFDKESPGANRERSRVRAMRAAFLALQQSLPAVPPDTKLSKLDVLLLASAYIAHLSRTLGMETGRPCVDGVPPAVACQDPAMSGGLLTSRPHGAAKDKQRAEARAATGNFPGFLHPMKKWPMRSRLYEGITKTAKLPSRQNCQDGRDRAQPTFLA